jgi:hypothetical protein
MSLFPLFRWFELTWLGSTIRMSTYLFPAIEVVHLFGLVLLLGTLVVVDMRMVGLGMRRQTVPQLFRAFSPLNGTGIALMLLSGIPLFLSEAIKCYQNDGFRMKMLFLFMALIFHFTIHRKVASSDNVGTPWLQLTGLLSLFLWFGVGLCGRAIAFV